jgi:hypothetical protein
MLIAYFAHELADAAVQKRVRMLRAGGRRVVLLGFEREKAAPPLLGTPTIVLGRTASGKFAQRAISVLTALPAAWAERKAWAKADLILARNLEALAIAQILSPLVGAKGKPIIYECLDIHRLMLRRDVIGKVMRAIERACLKRVHAVLTSSPAFVTHYFEAMQKYAGPVLLVENKVLALDARAPRPAAAPAGPPWKIAWCGVLRCARSLDLLAKLAADAAGQIEISLWGAPALDQIPDFHERVANAPHMSFRGAYVADDLPRIYAEAHFVWAVDYFEAGGNSDWLLPNRLYEGLYHGAIPIAAAGLETARWLEKHQVGVTLAEPLAETLPRFFSDEASSRYAALRAGAAALDPRLLSFSREDCRALLATP